MPASFAEAADGTILIANGIDPVRRWKGGNGVQLAGVVPPDKAPSLSAVGGGLGTISGTYFAFVRFIDNDGNVSNLSPVSTGVSIAKATGIAYARVPVPKSPYIVRKQILRNTDGQATTFYVDVDTDAVAGTDFTSSNGDAALGNLEPVPLFDTNGFPIANRYGVPPDTHPFLALHISRGWMAGFQSYAEGSVQVGVNSPTVQGIGTQWPANFAGRFLYVQGQEGQQILSVDADKQTLTLVDDYAGDTNLFAQYTIMPAPAERNVLAYSEAGLLQAWPPQNGLTLPEDGDVITGVCEFSSFLYIFKRRRTYRMTAQTDPSKDAFIFYACGRGCVNNRCWVVIEEKLYLLDESGVYATGGGDAIERLSTPIQNLFRPGDNAVINWGASRWFHANFDQAGQTIRWFVATSSSYLPKTALCLHYPTGKWWIEQYPFPIGSSLTARTSRPSDEWGAGDALVFLGGPAGAVYSLSGLLDGPSAVGPTTRGSVTAANLDSLTDLTAAFDTTASINAPCAIVRGRGKGQVRRVVSATATTLRLDEPWAVLPDTTSIYQIGAIPFKFLGGRLRYAPSEIQEGRSVEIQFQPTDAAQTLDLFVNTDFSAVPRMMGRGVGPGQAIYETVENGGSVVEITLDSPAGAFWARMDGNREMSLNAPRLFQVGMAGFAGPDPVVLGEMVVNGAVR